MDERWDVYHPVTSSFVSHSAASGFRNRKGRLASGRFNNVFELERLQSLLAGYDALVYLDEIVSGGGMLGHFDDMDRLGIPDQTAVVVAGVADRFGSRSVFKRTQIEGRRAAGRIRCFLWEGCAELITEDQKFLLGAHYVHYDRGLHVVPVLDADLRSYEEKTRFEQDVMGTPPQG